MKEDLAQRVSAAAFEERYTRCSDPWGFATSQYENDRYRMTLRSLSKSHYRVIFEAGCSVGVLTAALAGRGERVIAVDVSPSAVERAQARCHSMANVSILCENVATYLPPASLDLVVFSEIGYYFEQNELSRITDALASRLGPSGEFVAVHWLGESEDHVLHGDTVHKTLLESLPLAWHLGERYENYRIDSWVKS